VPEREDRRGACETDTGEVEGAGETYEAGKREEGKTGPWTESSQGQAEGKEHRRGRQTPQGSDSKK
jgi:hypothetical protein